MHFRGAIKLATDKDSTLSDCCSRSNAAIFFPYIEEIYVSALAVGCHKAILHTCVHNLLSELRHSVYLHHYYKKDLLFCALCFVSSPTSTSRN